MPARPLETGLVVKVGHEGFTHSLASLAQFRVGPGDQRPVVEHGLEVRFRCEEAQTPTEIVLYARCPGEDAINALVLEVAP